MRALLLAGGLGLRLRPLTNSIPKCLAPVGGRALLDIWLQNLTAAGIGPFLVNTHYLAGHVADYVTSSLYRDQVTLVNEPNLLGTAGTLISNLDFFEGRDGLLIHADNFCRANFFEFVTAHRTRPHDCVMTMMTFRTDTPSSCGIVELDQRGVVVGFHEKQASPPGNLANGAIYVLSAKFLSILAAEPHLATDFSTEIVPRFLGRIYTYETKEVFLDIGTPETYAHANRYLSFNCDGHDPASKRLADS